ncbi:hypothetical protein [Rhizobium leguminosarum]|uniref:hypothetical protein n=1 Tax=Rhizobium leguminosarum TaxID=384 RepID=UPI003F99D035
MIKLRSTDKSVRLSDLRRLMAGCIDEGMGVSLRELDIFPVNRMGLDSMVSAGRRYLPFFERLKNPLEDQ